MFYYFGFRQLFYNFLNYTSISFIFDYSDLIFVGDFYKHNKKYQLLYDLKTFNNNNNKYFVGLKSLFKIYGKNNKSINNILDSALYKYKYNSIWLKKNLDSFEPIIFFKPFDFGFSNIIPLNFFYSRIYFGSFRAHPHWYFYPLSYFNFFKVNSLVYLSDIFNLTAKLDYKTSLMFNNKKFKNDFTDFVFQKKSIIYYKKIQSFFNNILMKKTTFSLIREAFFFLIFLGLIIKKFFFYF